MTASVLFPLAITFLAVAYGFAAYSFPWMGLQEGFGPGLFPGIIAGLIAVLAGVEFIIQRTASRRASRAQTMPESQHLSAAPDVEREDFTGAGIVIIAVIATVLAIPVIGFMPAGTALVFALSFVMGSRPLWKGLLIAVATSVSIYLIFAKGFNVIFAF